MFAGDAIESAQIKQQEMIFGKCDSDDEEHLGAADQNRHDSAPDSCLTAFMNSDGGNKALVEDLWIQPDAESKSKGALNKAKWEALLVGISLSCSLPPSATHTRFLSTAVARVCV